MHVGHKHMPDLVVISNFVSHMDCLSSPVASLDAQSMDLRPSCEACLCCAEWYTMSADPDARSELSSHGAALLQIHTVAQEDSCQAEAHKPRQDVAGVAAACASWIRHCQDRLWVQKHKTGCE